MKTLWILLNLTLGALAASAQSGTTAYGFLDLPTSAHVFSLGGTNPTIIDEDPTLAQQNPALLGPEIGMAAAVSYMHYLGDSNFGSAVIGKSAGDLAAWGIGVRYLNYGSFEGRDETGAITGSFSAQDVVIGGTYSHVINDRLRGGINLDFIYSSYEAYTALALSADLGINYYDEERDLSLSLVLKNMGGQVKRFDDRYARLPFDLRLGWMQAIGHSPFSLTLTAMRLTEWKRSVLNHFIAGAQFSPSEKFYVAIAYNPIIRSDMEGYQRNVLSGWSMGIGLRIKAFGVGIAVAQPHRGATSLLLNLSTDIRSLL